MLWEVAIVRANTIEKIKQLQYLLAAGKTRAEVARELGYKDVTAIYHFASRHKLKWNPKTKNYEAEHLDGTPIEAIEPCEELPTGRAAGIIAMFTQGMDARDIAKQFRFKSSMEMAAYMKTRGYVWDDDIGNYVKGGGTALENEDLKLAQDDKTTEYIELLNFLSANKSRLVGLINQVELPGEKLPRYILPGVPKVKSINISSTLDGLVQDYSREFNISQKDIFQIALVEFFKKYGYHNAVKAVLKL